MAAKKKESPADKLDWKEIARLMLLSRALDDKEENELVPDKKVLYQFSARGTNWHKLFWGNI